MVAPGNVSWGPLKLEECKQVSEKDYLMLMDHVVIQPMDLVLSRNQTYGIASYVTDDTHFAIGQDTVLIQSKNISTRLAFLMLQSSLIQMQIHKMSAGSTFKRINLGDIRKIRFPFANNHIESRAVHLFESFRKCRENVVADSMRCAEFKRALTNNLVGLGEHYV